jgi:hypothetical protein
MYSLDNCGGVGVGSGNGADDKKLGISEEGKRFNLASVAVVPKNNATQSRKTKLLLNLKLET